ncbi:LacI family DNA-binding transcriptional regulator [Chitinophaga sedimenti]|uniref:LacI family DNA-binding transcriptional regulator n=1 Tax=Chitinophaga sedimenti TaxID=2033606 RepID=UPI0035577EA5
MSNRSKTIVDIAEELKLSVSTVSRALNDHPNISVKTKERVKRWRANWATVPMRWRRDCAAIKAVR